MRRRLGLQRGEVCRTSCENVWTGRKQKADFTQRSTAICGPGCYRRGGRGFCDAHTDYGSLVAAQVDWHTFLCCGRRAVVRSTRNAQSAADV